MAVTVLDKALFPRNKVCAGWITPAVVQALQLDTEAYARERVLQPITAFRTGLIDGGEVETRYQGTVSFGIRRCEFDDYLLQRSGARMRLGQTLKSLEKRGSHWLVNDVITTPLIIGAGGHFCPVARLLGAKLGATEPAVAAKEIEFEMDPEQVADCRVLADTPELYFCRDLRSEERRVGKECRSRCDWSSDVCSSDLTSSCGEGNRIRDGSRTSRRLPGPRGYAGTLFLPGSQGIRLVLPQRRLPQYRVRAGGQPESV